MDATKVRMKKLRKGEKDYELDIFTSMFCLLGGSELIGPLMSQKEIF